MGFIQVILIGMLLIAGVSVVAPDVYEQGKAALTGAINGKDIATINTQPPPQNSNNQSNILEDEDDYPWPTYWEEQDMDNDGDIDQDDYEQYVYGDYSDYGDYGQEGYPETNACDYNNYGYPDLIGTQREGETCTDSIIGSEDLDCLSNTPYNYDGEINLITQTSKPLITCCLLDGTCQW